MTDAKLLAQALRAAADVFDPPAASSLVAQEAWRQRDFETMELGCRAYNGVKTFMLERGIPWPWTVGAVADIPESQLLRMKGFGRTSLLQLRREIARLRTDGPES